LYLERYETAPDRLGWATGDALAALADIADSLVRISELTGRKAPSVVT